MTDSNRKTLRSFLCRDYLWDLFEVMTRDLGCSMDYLINESMRHYARSRNYSLPPHMEGRSAAPPGYGQQGVPHQQGAPQSFNNARSMDHHTFQRMPAVPPRSNPSPGYPPQPAQAAYGQPPAPAPMPPPPPPAPRAPGHPPYGGQNAPPPPPPARPQQAPPQAAQQVQLTLIFNNQRYPINKDKFIIGRGSTMTDLTIRDGNISRKHAAVIFRNGAYYIKDLDSTNGIDFRGNRIDSKKVEEGDAFNICDYELRFTYR